MVWVIADEWAQAQALSALAPLFAELGLPYEALDAVRLKDKHLKASVLKTLSIFLAERGHPADALTAARSIEDRRTRTKALAALARRFTELDQLDNAQQATSVIEDANTRTEALAALAICLAPPTGIACLARRLVSRGPSAMLGCAKTLAALVPHLASPERDRAVREALEAAQTLEGPMAQEEIITALARYLTADLIDEAFRAAFTLEALENRCRMLMTLAPHLAAPARIGPCEILVAPDH